MEKNFLNTVKWWTVWALVKTGKLRKMEAIQHGTLDHIKHHLSDPERVCVIVIQVTPRLCASVNHMTFGCSTSCPKHRSISSLSSTLSTHFFTLFKNTSHSLAFGINFINLVERNNPKWVQIKLFYKNLLKFRNFNVICPVKSLFWR